MTSDDKSVTAIRSYPDLLLQCLLPAGLLSLLFVIAHFTPWLPQFAPDGPYHWHLQWLLLVTAIAVPLWLSHRLWQLSQQQQQLAVKLQATFNDAAIGMAHVSNDGKILQANQRFADMLQLRVDDLRGVSFQQLTHPDDLGQDLKGLDAVLRGEIDSYDMEKRYRRGDGQYVWAYLSVSYHRGQTPQDSYFVSVIEDIQARKQAAEALQASMAQVRLLLDTTGDAIVGLNQQGEITFANLTAQQQLGYPDNVQLRGLPLNTRLHKHKTALAQWRQITKALEQPHTVNGEADLFVSLNGELLPVAFRAIPIPLAEDGSVLVLCWQNIRERRQQQLKQQAQGYLLRRLLDDAELPDMLSELLKFIESQLPYLRGSILLADPAQQSLSLVAAPSLPIDFTAAVHEVPVRYGSGSCGTAAATGQSVYTTDIHTDMLWLNYRSLAEPYQWMQACWSTPFFSANRRLLGTFGLYLTERREPTAEEVDLIQFISSLAAFLVERSQALDKLKLLSKSIEQSPVAVLICSTDGCIQYCNQRFLTLSGLQQLDIHLHPKLTEILPATECDWYLQAIESLSQGQPVPMRNLKTTDGSGLERWLAYSAYAITDRQQHPSHVLLELEDITSQKQAEQHWIESELRFRTLLDNTPQISVQGYEADGTTFYWNKASEKLYGYSRSEALGRNLLELIVPQTMQTEVKQAIRQMANSGEPIPAGELTLQHKNGQAVQVYSGHAVVRLPDRPAQIFCMDIDLAQRKEHEANQRLAEAVFNSSQEGILITDTSKVIISANPALERLFGFSKAELLGKTPAIFRSGRHTDDFYQQMWHQLSEQHYWMGEVCNRRKDGEVLPIQLSISAVYNDEKQITHYAAVFTDLSELRAKEAEMMFLTEHDELTHLPNRQLCLQLLEQHLKTAKREVTQVAVLMMDLDHFKDVNDSYGHQIGDQLLLQVASRLKQKVRDTDLVSRLGGDEFAIILAGLNEPQDAALVADKLIQSMSTPFVLENQVEVTLGASIGIGLFPEHGDNTATLLQGADAALYRAKAAGRNTFTFYSDAYTSAARDRLTLESQLRRAIKAGHLRVFYQPQVEIYSGRIIGAEALVRWFDPEQGMISPVRFIPVAEACGLINDIGEFVLTETCRQGQQWLQAGFPKLTLAVNVSPAQFRRSDMRKQVTTVLNQTGYPAHALELELTESALMENQETVIQTLNDLRGLGIRLAIDDFGTGYSSLAYLKRFPLDVLKIDKKFIDDIPSSQDDKAIATAIIGIAHTLGFKVLAEGVETQQQLDFLQQQRCDHYQGYFCSPPLPADKFQQLLEQQLKPNVRLVSGTL